MSEGGSERVTSSMLAAISFPLSLRRADAADVG